MTGPLPSNSQVAARERYSLALCEAISRSRLTTSPSVGVWTRPTDRSLPWPALSVASLLSFTPKHMSAMARAFAARPAPACASLSSMRSKARLMFLSMLSFTSTRLTGPA